MLKLKEKNLFLGMPSSLNLILCELPHCGEGLKCTDPDKALFSSEKCQNVSYFSMKTYVVVLTEAPW